MKQQRAIRQLLLALNILVSSSGLTYKEIAEKARTLYGYEDITEYQIRFVSNGKFKENKMIYRLDNYVDAVLEVLNLDAKDLIDTLVKCSNGEHQEPQQNVMPKEIRRFISEPNSLPYLEYAYAKYLQKKAEEKM